MHRHRLLWLLLPAALTVSAVSAPEPAGLTCHGPAVPLPQVCGATLRDPEISCAVPADVEGGLRQADWDVAYFIDQQDRPGRTATTGQAPSPPVVCPSGSSGQP